MLGNSVRGLTSYDKCRIYISNILPVLTYGKELWWNPHWKRIKWIHKELQVAQSRAARWITGGFRTTPIGALEVTAGLLPIKLAINRFMIQFAIHARMLHTGHPIVAHLPRLWHKSRLNITPPFPYKGRKTIDAIMPITHIHKIGSWVTSEKTDVLYDENRPGSHLIDEQLDKKIFIDTYAPKKGSSDFDIWVKDDLLPRIARANRDKHGIVVFTDGSQKKDYRNKRPYLARFGSIKVKTGMSFLVK